jgi:Domain of unknown function (DUF4440)
MKILSALLLSSVLFAGAAEGRQARRARKPPDLSEVITTLEARRFKAMTEADLVTLERILGDDLTYTHTDGRTESKAEFIETLRSGKLRYLSIEPANEKVRSYGTTAVGTGRAVIKVRSDGKETTLQIRFIDVYLRRHGRWQLVAWQSTRLTP